ncbi:MAG: methylmalonyl-CoA mutase family protein [Euryarchaeota archaeon]|nr:methylmalonyl-CoA mutase family protein [Euryarchaeota archaeon]
MAAKRKRGTLGTGVSGVGDTEDLSLVEKKRDRWAETTLARATERHAERKEAFRTVSGHEVDRLYTPLDLTERGYDLLTGVGFPGEAPFVRGVQPTMYRGRLWTMRQYAGFGSATETNKRFKYLLEQGQTGLSVAFDLPTQIGLDADHAMAAGEVGKTGVSISSLHDMEALLDGIPLDTVSTSMTINAPAAVLLAYYVAVGKKQGVATNGLRGTVQNDVLKEYIARGTYIYPPEPSLRLTTDLFAYCREEVPRWNTISISGYHIREAGSTAAQELAFTLANGITYVQAAIDRGLPVDDFAPQLSFFFNAHNDLFEEVAKFRAARRMWHRIMTERFDAKDPRSLTLRFHTQTGGSTLTAQQPENNVVRVALQALSASIGGTQSLHTNSMDEALSLPTEKAARIALRTQQILAHESGVANTVDPFAGSYFVESLTHDLEEEAFGIIDTIDRMGGMLKAIETGWVMKEIHEAAYHYQRAVEKGEEIVVGVNAHQTGSDEVAEIYRLSPHLEHEAVDRLQAVRGKRDNPAVDEALERLRKAARGDDNLLPHILVAAEAYATTGEICDAMRDVFGEHRATEM